MKALRHYFLVFLLTAVFAPVHLLAGQRQLWDGLVTFNVPQGAQVEPTNVDGWDEAFLVKPRSKKKQGVAALILRQELTPEYASLSTAELSKILKQQFLDSGFLVTSWSRHGKETSANFSGRTHAPWSKGKTAVDGAYRLVRITDKVVAGAIALAGDGSYGKASNKPFRQIVKTFRYSKPKKK